MSARVFDGAALDQLRLAYAGETLDPNGGPAKHFHCRECGGIMGTANWLEIFCGSGPTRINPRQRPVVRCQRCGAAKVFH